MDNIIKDKDKINETLDMSASFYENDPDDFVLDGHFSLKNLEDIVEFIKKYKLNE